MLTLYANNTAYPIKNDDYYIRQVDTGRDELIFNISIWDELYPLIVEEASIQDRDQMHYLVKAIDAGSDTAKVRCEIDLDEWRATLNPQYTNGSATCLATIQGVCPANWTVRDQSGVTISRTIEGAYTPLDVAEACKETYGITLRWDNKNRIVTIINPANYQPLGAFVTRDLNLKELNYKGSSSDFITRLYAYGKDRLSFASINNGLPYVDDNTYSSRIICGYWTDNRYEVAENLLADAKTKLAALAVPSRSYTCSVYDLAKTNPEMYGFEDFSLFAVVKLIDDSRGTAINHQVVEYWDYPHYPEKNDVVLSTSPARIQSQITQIGQQIENPNSSFNQRQENAINNATSWITGANGGYVVINKNASGQPYEILIMDQPTIAAATKVWRWNQGGLGYSSNGYNGPYTTAITQDGAIVANFITTGTLNAEEVNIINLIVDHLVSTSGTYKMEGGTGVMQWTDGSNLRVRIYATDNSQSESIGIVQVFSGNVDAGGAMQSGSLVSQLQPNYLEVGSDGKGNFSGQIKAGTIDTDQGASIGGSMSVNELLSIKGGAEIGGYADINGPLYLNSAQIRPGPNQNLLTVDWVQVPTSDGGTCWALASRS